MEKIEEFLLKVIRSCQTSEQLAWARQWAMNVMDNNPTYAVTLALQCVDNRLEVCSIEAWSYGERHPFNYSRRLSASAEC